MGQMRYETEFDWGGTRIFVSTAIVEGLRCFFIEPRNGFFDTPTVYGRYDDEVGAEPALAKQNRVCCSSMQGFVQRRDILMAFGDWSTLLSVQALQEASAVSSSVSVID